MKANIEENFSSDIKPIEPFLGVNAVNGLYWIVYILLTLYIFGIAFTSKSDNNNSSIYNTNSKTKIGGI